MVFTQKKAAITLLLNFHRRFHQHQNVNANGEVSFSFSEINFNSIWRTFDMKGPPPICIHRTPYIMALALAHVHGYSVSKRLLQVGC